MNPLLRQQLAKWVGKHKQPEPPPPPRRDGVPLPSRPTRELVAGGDVLWKPIDKTAALVVWKAPWWAKPPPSPTPPPQPPNPKRERKPMNPPNAPNKREEITAQIDNVEEAKVNARFASLTRKAVASSIDLTEQAIEMKAAMEVLVCHWKAEWLTFQQTCDTRIQELRQTRMAMETEMRLILSQLREVRGFFLERDYEQERARLAEFVDVCERLKALKESGFLDAVADVLLKLADRPETPPAL